MSELQVEIPQLRAFGGHFHTFGVSNVGRTGEATRVEAGQTVDMDGLLDLIAPAIHATAVAFGNHYDDVATVIAGTGTALAMTADDYAHVDHAVAEAMDRRAVSVGRQKDAPIGSGGAWSEHFVSASCHAIEPDPATRIRHGMDADVLRAAGIEDADAVVVSTDGDNTNIVIGQVARKRFDVGCVVVRVLDPARAEFYAKRGMNTICPTSTAIDALLDSVRSVNREPAEVS
jgi:hypothetical protein